MCKRQERTTWHLCSVRSLVSFSLFLILCVVFSKGKERRFGEGLLDENYNRIAAGGLGGPAITLAMPPPPRAPSAVGLVPSARQ